jgi:hypothetical protein
MFLIDYCNFCKKKHLKIKSYCNICKCCTLNKKCIICKNKKINIIISNCDIINDLINISSDNYKKIQKSNKLHIIENKEINIIITDYEKKLNDDYNMIINHIMFCNKKKCHDYKYKLIINKDKNDNDNDDLIKKNILDTHIDKIYNYLKTNL